MNFHSIYVNDIKKALPELFLITLVLILIIQGVILAIYKQNNCLFINKSCSWVKILILL
jgi:hypothetical protein